MKKINLLASWVLLAHLAHSQVRASALPKPLPALIPIAAARRGVGPEYGSVRRVLDGDTYEVLLPVGLVRLRLRGVDAPELSQPFGRQAADSAARLLRGRRLEVERGTADLYGRTLAELRVRMVSGTGRRWLRVDSLLVGRGWAWAVKPGQTAPRWALLQQLAQARHRGLWKCGSAAPIRPAVWRSFNKQEKLTYWGSCSW